ncbi:alpha/beta hydrolase, partial [Streptomyces rhizosphaericus]|uniref:alpha/beta hydrolase n=1 Tax=Streptomyces rhizosphaericus TaxID=114699 RepID=UPI0031E14B21
DILGRTDLTGLPPTLVVAAGLAPLRVEAIELAQPLQEVGVTTSVLHYPGAVHGFWSLDGVLEQAAELDGDIANFMAAL